MVEKRIGERKTTLFWKYSEYLCSQVAKQLEIEQKGYHKSVYIGVHVLIDHAHFCRIYICI